MSFLEELQKQKCGLKCTDTIVKTASGGVFLEKRNITGDLVCERVGSDAGFVVDLKPDLEVGLVMPGLLIGSQDVTQDPQLLKTHKVSHILSVGVQVCEIPGIKYTYIDALDVPEFNIRTVFEQSTRLINEIRSSGGSVFVHCNAGVSRSATIIIAYLMMQNHLKYQEAIEVLRKARPCVKPNEGFVKQLKLLEEQLLKNRFK